MKDFKAKNVIYGMVLALPVSIIVGVAVKKVEFFMVLPMLVYGIYSVYRPKLIYEYLFEEHLKRGEILDTTAITEGTYRFIGIAGGIFLVAFAFYIMIFGF